MQSLPYLLIAASALLLVQIINFVPMTYAAENLDRFWSILTGDQQTPPVTTDAIGYVGLKFQDDRTRLAYSVHAEHI
jgi:RNAse (barnase) inhibitor barstar